jgi:hypothetical protein
LMQNKTLKLRDFHSGAHRLSPGFKCTARAKPAYLG